MAGELTFLRAVAGERLARPGRERVPEPMVMDEAEGVAAFHVADPILQLPVYRCSAEAASKLLPANGRMLDLGSGTGRLLAHLAQARPDVRIVGTDLAEMMLETGRAMLEDEGLSDRVELRQADMTALPADLTEDVHLIACVWALHHLPDLATLHAALEQIAAVRRKTGCAVWLFDFARLRRGSTMEALVGLSPQAPARPREDGIASERAAWSAKELRAALHECGLGELQGGPVRLLGHFQAYWAHGAASGHERHWSPQPLPAAATPVHRRLRASLPLP